MNRKFIWGAKKCEHCGSRKVVKDLHGEERCGECLRVRVRAVDKMEMK